MAIKIDEIELRRRIEGSLFTIVEFAEACGLSQGTLTRLLRGQGSPRPSTVKKIAQELNCKPEEILKH